MKQYRFILLAGVFLFNTTANAADFVIEGGIHSGGDTLATVTYVGGDTDSIKAGELLSLAAGARFDISDSMESVITFGIKTDSISASNGDISFDRFPLNALVLLKSDDWRFGGGLTYHTGVEYSEETSAGSYTAEFNNALGFLVDVRYFISEKAYVGGRYTNIEYEVKANGQTFDGSSIGVVLGANL